MKNFVKIAAVSVALFLSSAQTSSAQYELGTNVINAGIGIGSTLLSGYSGSGFSQTPGIGVSFEHGTWELGDGIVSLGAYIGYKSYKWEDTYETYNFSTGNYINVTATDKWSYTIVGARGAYHFPISNDKVDLYAGLMLSYNILSYSYTTNDPNYNGALDNYSGSYGSGVGFSAFGGIRYYLTDNIGLNAELGYGVSYLTLGVSFKF